MAAATAPRSQEPSGGPNQDDRRAIFVLNTSAILIAAVAVILSGRKAGITGLAVATSVASLLSGPVLDLSQRRDPIALAVAVASVTSWYSALAILLRRARPSWTSFAWFGFAAGLTHIYAVDREEHLSA